MVSMKFLMRSVLDVGIIALVVIFQPELRRALEQVGRSTITDIGVFGGGQSTDREHLARTKDIIEIVTQSCKELSAKKTGALIVIERQIKLGEVIGSGTIIDAYPSVELIGNIFFTNSPLHDGAMVIRGGRLYAAGCFLPLSGNMEIGRELGTRHRAALGMSEESDAAVVVVSEETGAISVAIDSRLQRGLSPLNLQKLLSIKLSADESDGHARHRGLLSLMDKIGRGKKKPDDDNPPQK
jgi:diadenylate cyclase